MPTIEEKKITLQQEIRSGENLSEVYIIYLKSNIIICIYI